MSQTLTQRGRAGHAPRYRYGVLLPGYVVLAISTTMLAGSIFEPQFLLQIISSFGELRPDTAVGFLFLAMALLFLDSARWQLRAMSRGFALGAALIGAPIVLERLTGLNLGIDRLFFGYPWHAGNLHPGRMYSITAMNLVMLGIALLLLDFRWGRFSPSVLLTWITATLSFLTLTGSVYDPTVVHRLRMFSGVSRPALLVCLLLCVAMMFARPERGLAAILLSGDLGGQAARRLLPAAIFIPFAVSLLIFRLYQSGTYGVALMMFLFVVAPVLIFVPLVLLSASLLNRIGRERQRNQEELRVSTERFSSVVASAMDAIITLDESQNVIVFNEAAEKMFGCPSWEALGKPLDRFLPEQVRAAHLTHICDFGEAAVTTRSMIAPGILSAVRADGEQFPIEATVSQVQVAGKRLYTVILRDITERMHAEETLRQSEARFRSIYEQAGVGIAQVGLDGQMLMANAALCSILGYEERELLGKKMQEIVHVDDQVREAELLDAMGREQRQSYHIEKRYLHRDGSVVWVDVSSSVVNNSAGKPLYRISVIQNVTEHKCAEEQLKQAQKIEAVGRLAGGVAHDFNTLLNVMLGYSEILLGELPLLDPRREKVMQIQNAGNAAALVTRQLLAFSRKQGIAPEVLDLREVASRMTPILVRLLRDDIELTVRCCDEVCLVKVDPGQMQQLVLNLIANAGDAMPHGGQVNIEVRAVELDESYVQQHPTVRAGKYVMLAISDTGTGMDAETVSHIYEPFFTTKEAGKGTGLGLATVYGIAKRNGGDIWVYSEPGAGTTFKVYLPLTTEALEKQEAAKIAPTGAGGGGETILLVEDSAALRELTSVILERDGYNILQAEDGIAALEVSSNFQGEIHLVLTDVVMPRMRGPQLAEKILKQRPDTAIVFLSGYTEEAITQSDGITGFTLVEKPYTADALRDSIRRALKSNSSSSALEMQ